MLHDSLHKVCFRTVVEVGHENVMVTLASGCPYSYCQLLLREHSFPLGADALLLSWLIGFRSKNLLSESVCKKSVDS
jgi:hypothetical protein